MPPTLDTWHGCYSTGWQRLISPESFSHPAKFSRTLIQRIYQHLLTEGLLAPGDTVLDPFGGVGLGGLDAALSGIRWLGVELEPRFCALANGFDCDGQAHEALVGTFTPAIPARQGFVIYERLGGRIWGPHGQRGDAATEPLFPTYDAAEDYVIAHLLVPDDDGDGPAQQEDFRIVADDAPGTCAYLTFTWQVVTPAACGRKEPHAAHHVKGNLELWHRRFGHLPQWVAPTLLQGDSRALGTVIREQLSACVSSPPYANGCAHTGGVDPHPAHIQGGEVHHVAYGDSPGQLGALPPGSLDAAISSPPYASSIDHAPGNTTWTATSDKRRQDGTPYRMGASLTHYGNDPAQLGNMPIGALEAVVSSPPHCHGLGKEHTYADHTKREHDSRRAIMREKGIADPYYGSDPAQLGNMPAGEVQAVVSSPPYEGSQQVDNRTTIPSALSSTWRKRFGSITDGDAPEQLANSTGDTFWSAAAQIIAHVVALLRPGGVACFVVKSYVRDGQIVDFPGQWASLCASLGLTLLHEHHALLVEDHGTQGGLFGTDTQHTTHKKSFFRRLYEKGHPENAINYEVILCMQKGTSGNNEGVACAVSSPPWENQLVNHDSKDAYEALHAKMHRDGKAHGGTVGASVGSSYGQTDGQLGAMPAGPTPTRSTP
jgi:DNA methylase